MIGTNIGRKIAIAVAALIVVVAAIYLVPGIRRAGTKGPAEAERVSGETRSVTIYFGNREADGFETETREIPTAESFEDEVKTVIGELVKGSEDSGRMNAIPEGAELVQTFWIEDSQTLILDWNRAFVDNHPGGSTGEYYTISNVIKTIGANFPQVARVQFLVEGAQVESIAGHFAVDKPIDVRRWR